MALFGRNASKTEEVAPQNSSAEAVSRVKEADLAPPSLTLLLTKQALRNNLPKHAQEIYRAAFNSAEAQYGEESRAHRVAWNAVQQKYEKNKEGKWVEKGED